MPEKPTTVIAADNKTPVFAEQHAADQEWHLPTGSRDGHHATIGAKADTAADSDTGTFSLIALFKRLLQKLTAGLSVSGTVTANQGTANATPWNVAVTNRIVIQGSQVLTVDNTVGGKALPTIPADATGALVTVEGGDVRCYWDGTAPTASLGHLTVWSQRIELPTRDAVLAFRAIRTGATDGVITVTYLA